MAGRRRDPTDKAKPGPKPDSRHHVSFRVEHPVYEILAGLQPHTGQTPDQLAGLVLHMVLADPANAVSRLYALLGRPEGEYRPTLLPRGKDLAG